MNTFKSLLLGSILRVSALHQYSTKRIAPVSHVSLAGGDNLDSLTWKQLKKLCTAKKIAGRSKLTTKAKIIAALRHY